MKQLLLILAFLFLPAAGRQCYAQSFPMLHYTVEDGLPSNKVYGIFKDSRGFLWVGTDKGVARYNGIKFETFTTFNGLPDNEIFFFREDNYGRIWLATYNGRLCYFKDGVFHNDVNTPFLRLPFRSTYISVITLEPDSSVSFHFFDKKYLVNIAGQKMKVFALSAINYGQPVNVLFSCKQPDKGYRIFLSSGSMLMDSSGKVTHLEQSAPRGFRFVNSIDTLYLMDRRGVYDMAGREVYRFAPGFLDKNYVNSMCFANGLSFILTSNGLYYNDSVDILKDCNISSMRLDIMGNYWIATLNNGLYCLARDFAGSANYDRAYTGAIKYAYARKGRVFYTDNLDDLYGLDQGRARRIYSSHLLQQTVNQVSVERAYLIDTAFNYYYLHDRSNVILSHIDGPHPVAVHNNTPRLSAAVKAIFAVGDRVYIKQRSILCSFRKDDFGKTDFSYSLNSDSLSTERILGMAVNADGEVWYSNIGNVFKVVNGQGAVQRQFGDKTFRNFVFAGQCLVGYSLDNQLLVCSNIDGHITIDSLPAQNCIWDKLFVIDSAHVLISTDNLYHLLTIWRNGTRLAARVNAVDNPFIPLNAEAVCPDGDNCYFFKEGAVIRLNKSALLEQPKPPLLRFRGVRDGSTRYTIDSLVSIPYGSRNVVISFSALSFTGKKIVYEYSISGMEGDSWMPLKSEEINLFNPEYGTYIVKVRARSVSGEFCAPITFVLEVRRPFWAAWWFIGLCVAVVAAVVVAVVRRRIARTVREKDAENENKLKFMRSEYKALNALMNPHFIFNTLNNVQGLINSNDRLAANEYLRVFADMVRQNMHNISKELIPLTREIELVENYLRLEKLRFKELLNYRVDIDDEVDASLIMVPPLLIQPLVENSIKHGILPLQSVEGMIIVHVYERNELLYIEVRDNGAGMSGSAHKSDTMHESFGLNNIKERIAQLGILLNKQINFEITEEKDAGSQWTVVTISMEG